MGFVGEEVPVEVYQRAESRLEWHVALTSRHVDVVPTWLDDDRFAYQHQAADGSRTTLVVDAATGASRPAGPDEVPTPPAVEPGQLALPDGRRLAERDGDLWLVEGGQERRLTLDGTPDHGYGIVPDSSLMALSAVLAGTPLPPAASPSPDGRRLVTHRLDQRGVTVLPYVQSVPADDPYRPRLHTLRVPLPGDEVVPTARLVVVDLDTGATTDVDGDALYVPFLSPLELGRVTWSADGRRLWVLDEGRAGAWLALREVDVETGAARTVLEEADGPYVEPSELVPWPSLVRVLESSGEVLWRSDRTGWSHLDLHDLATGERTRSVTSGEWEVVDLVAVDPARRWAYVLAAGRDPAHRYARQLVRAHLDEDRIEAVTPDDGLDHRVWMSPGAERVVDVASAVDRAPVVSVRPAAPDGSGPATPVDPVVEASIDGLTATGWVPPRPITTIAADGRTELSGVLFLPSDFDPDRRYPVVDHLYPGPQLKRTPTWFTLDSSSPGVWPGAWYAQAIAELGIVVLALDGPGTPWRGRDFHLASHGHLQDIGGLDDHVAALDQLAADRPWFDRSRVGVVGHSGGGYAAARALLARPDVYSVGVAGSGSHDLRRYIAYWGEKYQGLEASLADDQANVSLADRLEGHLLLLHGDMDDNVHPSATIALVDALVRADKDFDLVVLPNQSHGCVDHPYYLRRMWDFLVRHLVGAEPPRYRVRGRDEV